MKQQQLFSVKLRVLDKQRETKYQIAILYVDLELTPHCIIIKNKPTPPTFNHLTHSYTISIEPSASALSSDSVYPQYYLSMSV